jgi:NTE family protein
MGKGMTEKTVSLVLGAGGARGLAHIGVIEWLEQNDFEICSIAGSSMGALVGGIYAARELDTYTHWVTALQRIDVIRLLDLSFSSNGLIKGNRVIEALQELIGDRNIEDLPISFTAVATDIEDQKEVWLNRGSLFEAIRASIAIPTIFTPVEFRGGTLLDGGLLNPIPIAPTLSDKTDITIAVNLSAKPVPHFETPMEQPLEEEDSDSYSRRISQFVDTLQQMFDKEDGETMGFFDILSNTMDTMQNMIARFQLAAYTPDVIVDIPRNICTFYEFERAREMIEIGRQYAAREIAPAL